MKCDDPTSPDYVPSIFDFTSSPEKKRALAKIERYKQRKDRSKKIEENTKRQEAAFGLLDLFVNTNSEIAMDTVENGQVSEEQWLNKCCQSDITLKDISNLQHECQQLRNECLLYKSVSFAATFREDSFKNDDEKVKYCTGLPSYAVMMVLFQRIYQFFRETQSVSKFQQFILTLMRLRLDVPQQFLAYVFGISEATVSRILHDVIDVMNARLVPSLVFWPQREELRMSMPMSFRNKFRQCACIIDCFEIFIERPSDLRARADTYSQYKSHNTIKYLIGIAPQGVTTFISKGWGGRTSDVFLTENCGFLDNLMTGDLILADRGFTVADSVALYNAELKIPAFTKGRKQLSPLDVEMTRVLASVRIHVERVIGMTRQKYTMLQSTIPITLLQPDINLKMTTLDKIVRVACAMTNLSPSCVPFD